MRPPGMAGGVGITAQRIGDRTRLTSVRSRPPLQVLRAHYLAPALPDIAMVTLASTAGGVLQGDRLEIDITVGRGARLLVGTQSATRLYAAPLAEARIETSLHVASGGYLEYLPDPYIPFAGSRLTSRTRCLSHPDATVVVSEIVAPGRVARGEVHAFARFESVVEVLAGDGSLIASDVVLLEPGADLASIGMLGGYRVVGSLVVLHSAFDPSILRDALAADEGTDGDVVWGSSRLPGDAGAWLRVLAMETGTAAAAIDHATEAVRQHVLGAGVPASRRP